ncbi:protein of unknown function (DUF1206) [Xenococcus sp. PCC 7305]|nr:protein of unknown function (DUF1206) [Xenococcus sp. PCC 7305]
MFILIIMETLARFGYVAKGFVYGAIGLLALLAAFSNGRIKMS